MTYNDIRMNINTVLVRYDHSVRKKQYNKTKTKHTVKAWISAKTILFNDSVKCLAFSAGYM